MSSNNVYDSNLMSILCSHDVGGVEIVEFTLQKTQANVENLTIKLNKQHEKGKSATK